jgi:DNA-binding transcriptional regulator YiaG
MLASQFAVQTPFGEELARFEIDHVSRLIERLRQYDPQDKPGFAGVIAAAMRYGPSQNAIAEEFRVSPATISRWANGRSVPAAHSRGVIVEAICNMLQKEIKETEPLLREAM